MYRKLKRVWSNNDMNYIPKFRETFPELNKIDSEELADRFQKLDIEFYTEKKSKVHPLVRLTLPFALVLMLLMFAFIPIKFIITGEWYYGLSEENRILNWFRQLKVQ